MTNEELDKAREIEAIRIYDFEQNDPKAYGLARIAARLAREGWTPPEAVDPDLAEARKIYHDTLPTDPMGMTLAGIKRGRALAAAEAKPGMVWVRHDQSNTSPVPGLLVTVKVGTAHYQTDQSFMIDWYRVTHYAVITPPEDVA